MHLSDRMDYDGHMAYSVMPGDDKEFDIVVGELYAVEHKLGRECSRSVLLVCPPIEAAVTLWLSLWRHAHF